MSSNTTPAVSRAGFSFDASGFWAEGEGYRGIRLSLTDLQAVLAVEHARGQDKSVQFYAAQLVHYGMKPMKTKDAIKKKLLSKVNDGSLKVPNELVVLEQELMEEWLVADKARKAELQPQPQPQAETQIPEDPPKFKARTRQTARKSNMGQPRRPPPAETDPFDDAAHAALRTMRPSNEEITKRVTGLSKKEAHDLILELLQKVPANGPVFRKAMFPRQKAGGKKPGERLSKKDWEGTYRVPDRDFLYTLDQGDELTIDVSSSSTSSHLWMAFDFGTFSGVMRSIKQPPSVAGERVPVEWWGHTNFEEREMTFGVYNYGYLRFWGKGLMEVDVGCPGLGKLLFAAAMPSTVLPGGAPQEKPLTKAERDRMVAEWKREFRSINSHNHDLESKRRWGGSTWGREEEVDLPYASDTSVGSAKRDVPSRSFEYDDFSSDPDSEEDCY